MCIKYGANLSIEYLIGDAAGPITPSRADKLNTEHYEGPRLLKVNNMEDKWNFTLTLKFIYKNCGMSFLYFLCKASVLIAI